MAQRRMISKSLGSSKRFAALHTVVPQLADFCQAVYPILVPNCDDFGRYNGDAFTIKHSVFPTNPHPEEDFEIALQAYHAVGLIIRYESKGNTYLEVTQFDRHQYGLARRSKSYFPALSDGVEHSLTVFNSAQHSLTLPNSDEKFTTPLNTHRGTGTGTGTGTGKGTGNGNGTGIGTQEPLIPSVPVLGEFLGTSVQIAEKAVSPKNGDGLLEAFERGFWPVYPKKVAKGAARKAFLKACHQAYAKPSEIIDAVRDQLDFLNRDGGKYCPNPATWLNDGRWQDEPPLPARVSALTQQNMANSQHAMAMLHARKKPS